MAMSKATTQRDKEKATNTDTMKDAQAGEAATKAALTVLKEFYASQGSRAFVIVILCVYVWSRSKSHIRIIAFISNSICVFVGSLAKNHA